MENEPKIGEILVCDMGKEAYLEFHRAIGQPPPTAWEDMSRYSQSAWYRAARAAFNHFIHVTSSLRFGMAEDG